MNTNDLIGEIGFLARELKTPVIAETFTDLGDRARAEGWSHEQYLAAVLGARGPHFRSAWTCSMIACARWVLSAATVPIVVLSVVVKNA